MMNFFLLIKFLYPEFLWALFSLIIPIIIHFLQFKKPKIYYFSFVKILKEIEVKRKKSIELKKWLLLILRLLFLTSIIFAFANPVYNQSQNRNLIKIIYIDNSVSLAFKDKNSIPIFNSQNESIKKFIENQNDNTLYYIVTNNFVSNKNFNFSKKTALNFINNLNISDYNFTFENQIKKIYLQGLFENINEINVFSNFNEVIFNNINSTLKEFKDITFNFFPITTGIYQNIFIDSLWTEKSFDNVSNATELKFKLNNLTDKKYSNFPVKTYLINEFINLSSPKLENNSSEIISINISTFSKNNVYGKLELADYYYDIDNAFYYSLNTKFSLNILHLFSKNKTNFFKILFQKENINYKQLNQKEIVSSDFKNLNFLILDGIENITNTTWNDILAYVDNGGKILIFPPENNINDFNKIIEKMGLKIYLKIENSSNQISNLNFNSPLFKGVFKKEVKNLNLPEFKKYYSSHNPFDIFYKSLINYKDNFPFLIQKEKKSGIIYLFTIPLDEKFTNFPKHSIFPPLIYNLLFLNQINKINSFYINTNQIQIPNSKNVPQNTILIFENAQTKEKFTPKYSIGFDNIKITLENFWVKKGNFLIYSNDTLIESFSLNIPNSFSKMIIYEMKKLNKLVEENLNISLFEKTKLNEYDNVIKNKNNLLNQNFLILFALFILFLEGILTRKK